MTPATAMPRARATSTVSAVWLSVPRPGRATISSGRPRASARSANVSRSLIGHEQAARALDEDAVGAARAAPRAAATMAPRLGSGAALEAGGDDRRDGRLVAQAVRTTTPGTRARDPAGVVVGPGLRGLEHRHAPAGPHAGGGQRGRHVGLADARVGPGDEQVGERRELAGASRHVGVRRQQRVREQIGLLIADRELRADDDGLAERADRRARGGARRGRPRRRPPATASSRPWPRTGIRRGLQPRPHAARDWRATLASVPSCS